MRCDECGHEMRFTDGPITETHKGEKFTVDGVRRWVCDECGNDLMDVDEAERLAREVAKMYAERNGLLLPEEIREARASLGLTQEQFERLLGASFPAASRWENGATVPSKAVCKLIRGIRDDPAVREYYFTMEEMAGDATSFSVPAPASADVEHGGWSSARTEHSRTVLSARTNDRIVDRTMKAVY